MAQLIQIIYISRSTFARSATSNGIEPNVGRILQKSRINNHRNGLVGVLYFGDDCFFQCLEGEQNSVEALYAKLEQDTRHKDLKIISRKAIAAPSFREWAMKYVPLDREMNQLLKKHGYQKFDPYAFSAEMTESVMALLHAASDLAEARQNDRAAGQPAAKEAPVSKPAIGKPAIILMACIAIALIAAVVWLKK